MDIEKFKVLTELVKEARAEDKRTIAALATATAEWKAANQTLTERSKVLTDWLQSQVNEHTAV